MDDIQKTTKSHTDDLATIDMGAFSSQNNSSPKKEDLSNAYIEDSVFFQGDSILPKAERASSSARRVSSTEPRKAVTPEVKRVRPTEAKTTTPEVKKVRPTEANKTITSEVKKVRPTETSKTATPEVKRVRPAEANKNSIPRGGMSILPDSKLSMNDDSLEDDDLMLDDENRNDKKEDKNHPKKNPSSSGGNNNNGKKKGKIGLNIRRVLFMVATLLVLIIAGLAAACGILFYGPSKSARDVFVISATETSALKWLPKLYLGKSKTQEILDSNSVAEFTEVTNSELVNFEENQTDPEFDLSKIEIVDVKGDTYKGKMMIINDPSRVFVGTSGTYGEGLEGKRVPQMLADYDAIAAINAGGFEDNGGVGKGGCPQGLVISEGQLLWGSLGATYEVIGIDNNNVLVVGNMTGQQAIDRGIRDAVCFGPALIVNGEAAEVSGAGSGLNPRSAIGQRADGAILLLCIDGRAANSLGASYEDVIYQMQQFGAVNAANLDGGSSSVLMYEGEVINTCSSLYGPRRLPTAFLVTK